ncbi:puromycin resistance protein pur8 [Verticillium dahliae VdLs.17]|uniref:Puromycin resistance protein pur8 n=2 Tax=Verticillium dahliae TaxID=27337 RepID=G2WW97_VERDV|nr:puromycin resistance protein pur8 [Verticillium dahliae VdLs.17]EGY19867.1 puromycin resistance protein pur8 [Verticillium dahliae VdLs.17]KAH6706185.1 puromycin resistance protein pur8 [Verticillium dahliae]
MALQAAAFQVSPAIELQPISAPRPVGAAKTFHPDDVTPAASGLLANESTQPPSRDPAPPGPVPDTTKLQISKAKGITVIVTLAGMSFLNTMGSGILTAALPRISRDVGLSEALILWPAAVYALAAGCLLLIFGAIADVVGPKQMWVTGSFLFIVFTVAVGLAQTGLQLILFRTMLGVAISICLPTAPLGYALGLVLGGIFTDTIGWRWAYHMMAGINLCLSLASIWSLPSVRQASEKRWTRRLVKDLDWVGALIMSVALGGLLLYVLAMTSSSYRMLSDAPNIALLSISVFLLASFPAWMAFQTRNGGPALLPNRLWRNAAFTSVCLSVFFCWAALNGVQYFTTLYFQEVQGTSAMTSSLQFLPHVVAGVLTNIATAYLISRVKVQTLAVVSGIITVAAPVLMATVPIDSYYWHAPFWALVLSPINPDVFFTVSNLVISDAFPADLQSLAGGVFNEVAQFGNSVGLAATAAIAASVSEHSGIENREERLMAGYRAAFWTMFAGTVAVVIIVKLGLRKGGTVGKKDV